METLRVNVSDTVTFGKKKLATFARIVYFVFLHEQYIYFDSVWATTEPRAPGRIQQPKTSTATF